MWSVVIRIVLAKALGTELSVLFLKSLGGGG